MAGRRACPEIYPERQRCGTRSRALFDPTDKIASRKWTMAEVKQLLRDTNDSMHDELKLLESLDFTVTTFDDRGT